MNLLLDTHAFLWFWWMVRNHFELLQITDEHLAGVVDLPFHHRDPFDRMLVAQSLYEGIPMVSADSQLDAYGVNDAVTSELNQCDSE